MKAINNDKGLKGRTIHNKGKRDGGKVDSLNGTPTWLYMTCQHALTGEQLMNLRQATCKALSEGKPVTLVRIFNPAVAKEKDVKIEDFADLDKHSELILYEGYYTVRGRTSDILIERRNGVEPSLLEKKMKEGAITEVGARIDDTTTLRWIKRLENFLICGGWLVVLAAVIGITAIVWTLTKGK